MNVVFQGKSKKGKDIIIRYPEKSDTQAMRDYINFLSKEQTFIRFQGETISLPEEEKYVNSQLERIAKKNGVKRISKQALEETREIIEELGLELAEKAVKVSRFAGKKTVMEEDVKFVTEKRHE